MSEEYAHPIETVTPRDVARLLEQLTQCAEDAKAALVLAEQGDYHPMAAFELTTTVNAARDVADSAARGVQHVLERRRVMDRQMAQIRDLPEAGDR